MIELMPIDPPKPQELWGLMDQHNLISTGMLARPGIVADLCRDGEFTIWHIDTTTVALQTLRADSPGVLRWDLIPTDRHLGKDHRDELRELGPKLREEWFKRCYRVTTMIPASRVNLQRIVHALGFVPETRKGVGLRKAIQFKGDPEALLVYGLTEDDPVREVALQETA